MPIVAGGIEAVERIHPALDGVEAVEPEHRRDTGLAHVERSVVEPRDVELVHALEEKRRDEAEHPEMTESMGEIEAHAPPGHCFGGRFQDVTLFGFRTPVGNDPQLCRQAETTLDERPHPIEQCPVHALCGHRIHELEAQIVFSLCAQMLDEHVPHARARAEQHDCFRSQMAGEREAEERCRVFGTIWKTVGGEPIAGLRIIPPFTEKGHQGVGHGTASSSNSAVTSSVNAGMS